jgi:hypothetical protein
MAFHDEGTAWFYIDAGKAIGPMSGSDLRRLIEAEVVTHSTKVRQGTGTWVNAGDLAELFSASDRERSSAVAPTAESTKTSSTSRPRGRRRFGALETVAKITDWIAILYGIVGLVVAIVFVATCFSGDPGAFAYGFVGAAATGLGTLIAVVFIRAMAEGIRVVLYGVELLEDIRGR